MKIPEHYDNLDAPVFVWQKVHETQDVTYLLVKREKIGAKILKVLQAAWEKIYDEYLSEFGFSEAFLSIKRKELHIAQMQMEMILTGDRSLQTFIEIEQQEVEEMKRALGKVNFLDSKKAIEYRFKFQISMKETSIKEFYNYLKDIK